LSNRDGRRHCRRRVDSVQDAVIVERPAGTPAAVPLDLLCPERDVDTTGIIAHAHGGRGRDRGTTAARRKWVVTKAIVHCTIRNIPGALTNEERIAGFNAVAPGVDVAIHETEFTS
jgi:hypothetical protein